MSKVSKTARASMIGGQMVKKDPFDTNEKKIQELRTQRRDHLAVTRYDFIDALIEEYDLLLIDRDELYKERNEAVKAADTLATRVHDLTVQSFGGPSPFGQRTEEPKMTAADYIRKGWTQGVAARDQHGIPCQPDDERAVAWCLSGAFRAAYMNVDYATYMTKRAQLFVALGMTQDQMTYKTSSEFVAKWNDDPWRTKNEVIAVLEKAGL